MAKMAMKGLVAALLACGLGVMLSACGSTSDFVADHWPHFAGGEPNDVPPRPGSPGYQNFIAHGQPAEGENAPAASGQAATGGVTPEFAARQPGSNGPPASAGAATTAPAQKPVAAEPPPPGGANPNVGQGGLY